MRPLLSAIAAVLACATPAQAHTSHVVRPGETLTGIAATAGVPPAALAAANGLPADAFVLAGTTLSVPGHGGAGAQASPAAAGGAPQPMGGYTVQPGDTLSGLAARAGVPVAQMAQMNGLAPDAVLVSGTALKLPTGAPVPAPATSTTPAAPAAGPQPTGTRLSSAEVSSLAAQAGAPAALAAAIAWQESGNNNAVVSSAGARGVMQVMPGTWQWVQDHLAGRPLDPSSATDNVHAGALYLRQLLREAGGDEATAIAGYYQGLSSVRRIGMLPETRRYVANVQALRARMGG